jgi:hypothetical protein
MISSHNRFITSATQPCVMLLGCVGCVALMLFLSSCGSIPPSYRENPPREENGLPPRYSLVIIIHGDGDYLYHDTRGRAHRADEEALAGAIGVAARNPQAEVFIFHQRHRMHTLLFFPRRDGTVYYYRHGTLISKESYWRDHGQSRFDPEMERYHRFRAAGQTQPVRMFLYFGHEIPEFDRTGYDASYPHRTFDIHDLADGLKTITRDSAKFDLVVLSTCFNGTPRTVAALSPYARTIVASPENLHLSYLDLQPFERLDAGLRDRDVAAFAKKFAREAFNRLTEDLQTSVTVAVYDVDRAKKYFQDVDSIYNHSLIALKGQKPGSVEHFDCAEDSATMRPGMGEGVDVFYHPPRFGRSKHKQTHSGWECSRLVK